MAGSEQITSPDQRKVTSRKAMYAAFLIGAFITLTYLFGNHTGWVEDVFLVVTAAILVGIVAADVWLRKAGLR
jgi:hypothetical protein